MRLDAGRDFLQRDVHWSGTFKVHGVMGTGAGWLHEIVRVCHDGRCQEHRWPEFVAKPLRVPMWRSTRVRQKPVDFIRRPDGRVPSFGLLGHHVLRNFQSGRRTRHVLHNVQDTLGRERCPVSGQLRKIRSAAEPVHAVRVIVLRPTVRHAVPVAGRGGGFVGHVDGPSRPRCWEQTHGSQVVAAVDALRHDRTIGRGCRVVFSVFNAQHSGQKPVVDRRSTIGGHRRLLVFHVFRIVGQRTV